MNEEQANAIFKSFNLEQALAFDYAVKRAEKGKDYNPNHKIKGPTIPKNRTFRDIYATYTEDQQDLFIYVTTKVYSHYYEDHPYKIKRMKQK